MKKIILLIFSLTIILLSIQVVKAESVTRVMNDYYYLRTHPDGTRFSDRDYTYYINGKVVYCIEPGVRLGSDYSVLDNYNIPYENKLRILLAAQGGYLHNNHNDFRFAIATQSIIWQEILGTETIYSTELWGKGEILDLTYFKSVIYGYIENKIKQPNLINLNDIIVGNPTKFNDKNGSLGNYDISIFTPHLIYQSLEKTFDEFGYHTIKLDRKPEYNYNYKIYGDSNHQHLLMPGDIPELNYSKEIYVNPITYNFKIIDSETKNEVDGVTLKVNDTIISNKDSYILYYNEPLNVNIESVPDGYNLNESIETYKIYNELNHTIVLSIDPIYNDYIINKTYDDIYPEENAIFELINDKNNNLQGVYTTNSDGKFNLHLKYGNYTLNQLKGIDGYKLISYKINNSKPNSQNTFTINLNDEKIINEEKISNNNDQVYIIDDSFAQYLVSTGNKIPIIILLLIFPLICLLTKKIIVI
ncbi:MAG: Cys-Gln thioester bond-forming surface protein [Bacilli bacterium]|nr:Cys-Gln thioester bond-forming surface protein [Bacilli bacterium]